MHYLSHRDLGDESRIRGTDWATVRDAAGRIAHIIPNVVTVTHSDHDGNSAARHAYPCSSDDYHHGYRYPHGDDGERDESGVIHD